MITLHVILLFVIIYSPHVCSILHCWLLPSSYMPSLDSGRDYHDSHLLSWVLYCSCFLPSSTEETIHSCSCWPNYAFSHSRGKLSHQSQLLYVDISWIIPLVIYICFLHIFILLIQQMVFNQNSFSTVFPYFC